MKKEDSNKVLHPPRDVTVVTTVTVEHSLNEELLKLSYIERNAIYEEIHGVRCLAVQETPELVGKSLREFDKELAVILPSCLEHGNTLKNVVVGVYDDNAVTVGGINESSSSLSSSSSSSASRCACANTSPRTHNTKQPCYVNDPQVRLRFLRCESFNAKKAVKRFVSFLEFTRELFGDFVSERPITFDDFSVKESSFLEKSRTQWLPFRDRSGRRVLVGLGSMINKDPHVTLKFLLYLCWTATEDLETQQKGAVFVLWPYSEENKTPANSNEEDDAAKLKQYITGQGSGNASRLESSIPVRIASIHFCAQNKAIHRSLCPLFYFGLISIYKTRFIIHSGEPIKLRETLLGYGIPVDMLPLTHTGTLKFKYHSQWISFRPAVEAKLRSSLLRPKNDLERNQKRLLQQELPYSLQSSTADNCNINSNSIHNNNPRKLLVECPGSYDVIFRKGKTCSNNPGNIFFNNLIEDTYFQHIQAETRNQQKIKLIWNVIETIELNRGRLLEWDGHQNGWTLIKDRSIVRNKIAYVFRELRRKYQPNKT